MEKISKHATGGTGNWKGKPVFRCDYVIYIYKKCKYKAVKWTANVDNLKQ